MDCQRAAWRQGHKSACLPHVKQAAFVEHICATHLDKFESGPFMGLGVREATEAIGTPMWSKRQFSLRDYVMMLSANRECVRCVAARRGI